MNVMMNITGLRSMLRYSSKRLLLNRRWILVVLLTLLVAFVMGYAAYEGEDTAAGGSYLLDLLVLAFLLPVLSMIYGASLIRNDIDDRSITPVITAPLDRRVSYIGYYATLVLAAAVILLLVNLVGWSSYFLQNAIDADAVNVLLSYSAVLALGVVAYSSLFLALGVVLKQPIYVGLIYAFVWEGFIGSLPGAIGQFTIMRQLKIIASSLLNEGNVVAATGNAGWALFALVLVTVVLLVLGAIAFREKEVP